MIYGIHGRIRSGKTLFLTAILFWSYIFGRQVWSNYKLNFPTNKDLHPTLIKFLKKWYSYDITKHKLLKPKKIDVDYILDNIPDSLYELDNCVVGIDEGYLHADARKSMSEKNLNFSYAILQTGKHDTDVFMIYHQLRLGDVRYEENSHYDIFCGRYPTDQYQPLKGVHIIIKDDYTKSIARDFLWTNFNMYYNMYNTKEIIWSKKVTEDTSEQDITQLVRMMKGQL